MHVHDTLVPYSTDWFYLWEAEAVSWTAGFLYMTGSWLNLKTSPTIWWRTDMLPNPEAKSSGSRCCLSSTDREPCLKNTSHWKLPLYNQRPTYNLCITLVLTSLSLLPLCNWAPQNIYSSCNCSSYSTNDTPVFYHLVSEKTTLCLRYSKQDFLPLLSELSWLYLHRPCHPASIFLFSHNFALF